MEEPKAARKQRCVNVLVALAKQQGVDNLVDIDNAIDVLRPRLIAHFARKKLKKRSRGIISILGLKRRSGRDMWDEHLDEEKGDLPETEEQREESKMIVLFKKYENAWAFWRFFIQMYIFAAVLFRICFEVPRDWVSWLIEFIFVDMTMWLTIIYRFVGYHDDRGVPFYRPKQTAEEYLKSWFLLDLIGVLPVDFVGMGIAADWAKCTIRYHRCGFIAPYWQANRILNCRGMFDTFSDVLEVVMLKFDIHPYVARVMSSFLQFLAVCHTLGCGAFVLYLIYQDKYETIQPGGKQLGEVSQSYQYAACLEWTAKNLCGLNAGFAFPGDSVQLIYNVITAFVGVTLFGLLLATIANYVSRPSPEADFQQDMDAIIDIMDYKNFPDEIRRDVLEHMRHTYDARTHLSTYHTALDGLPEALLDRVLLKEGYDALHRVPLFQPHMSNKRFIVNLARMLQPEVHPPRQVIFEKGDVGESMYFVIRGSLGVVNHEDQSQVLFEIKPGGFVGEIALLMDGPRTATVAVVGDQFADVMTLHKDSFQKLSGQFPKIFRSMQEQARERFLELNKDLFASARKLGEVDDGANDLTDAVHEVMSAASGASRGVSPVSNDDWRLASIQRRKESTARSTSDILLSPTGGRTAVRNRRPSAIASSLDRLQAAQAAAGESSPTEVTLLPSASRTRGPSEDRPDGAGMGMTSVASIASVRSANRIDAAQEESHTMEASVFNLMAAEDRARMHSRENSTDAARPPQ